METIDCEGSVLDLGEFKDRDLVCPLRTEIVTFQLNTGSGIEQHQQTFYMPCYKDECPFFKHGVCRKIEENI